MILYIHGEEYEITEEQKAEAIADIMWQRKQDFIREHNSQLKLDRISYRMGIINTIMQAETTNLQDAFEEEFRDELTEIFTPDAEEQFRLERLENEDLKSFRIGGRGTYGD